MANGDKSPTRGGDMLARCPDSHAEIAAKMGVDKSLVTRWRSGARRPSDEDQGRLEEFYGIPRAAWNEPPAPMAKVEGSASAAASPVVHRDAKPSNRVVDYANEDNNERLQRYIRDGMTELELDVELSGVKRAEALKKLVDAQVALDKSTGENALTMARIAAHPEFLRVVRLITEAIEPYPEARNKVMEILRANP